MIEDKDVAMEISRTMLEFGKRIDNTIAMAKEKCSKEEFESYRKAAGRVMGIMLVDIMNPIYQKHPEIKPEQLA